MDILASEIIEIPIFPLTDVVFFPGTVIPLHIFEPRYRQMVSDSLSQDRRIGIILANSEPGGSLESGFPGVGGLGLITDYQEREEGKYDILLTGVSRFQLIEFVKEKPYRIARVRLLGDNRMDQPEDRDLRRRLISGYKRFSGLEEDSEELEILEEAGFETLVNSVCSVLPLATEEKQRLLETDDVADRAEMTLEQVDNLLAQKEFVDAYAHLRPEDPLFN